MSSLIYLPCIVSIHFLCEDCEHICNTLTIIAIKVVKTNYFFTCHFVTHNSSFSHKNGVHNVEHENLQNIYFAKSAVKIEKVRLTLLISKHKLNVNVWERIALLTHSTVFRWKAIFSSRSQWSWIEKDNVLCSCGSIVHLFWSSNTFFISVIICPIHYVQMLKH